MNLIPGEIFKIETKKGFGFLQYVETTKWNLQYVRVLNFISKTGNINQKHVNKLEKWSTEFPLKAAIRKKIVTKVGYFKLPQEYKVLEFARSPYIVRSEFLGWHIVNRQTLQRKLKKELSEQEIKLSPYGIMNDILIIQYLESDWKLEKWK